jgi:hypothetical protein
VLPFADHITVLSGNGHIADHYFSPVDYGNSETVELNITASSTDDHSDKEDALPGHGEYSGSASALVNVSEAAITDASDRQTGDMSVYLYYVRAAGFTATACFLIVTAACTFCESFAGELEVHKRYPKTLTDVGSALASMVGRIGSCSRTRRTLPGHLRLLECSWKLTIPTWLLVCVPSLADIFSKKD